MSTAMMKASQLQVRRRTRVILDSIDLEIRPGELLALIGPNGAGKSTLLSALAGEHPPERGEVELDGVSMASIKPKDRAQRLAVLPQESRVDFPFNALEVTLLGRVPYPSGSESGRELAIAKAALQVAGVGHLAERIYPTLSGGERQRVQLARVLAQLWEPPASGARYLFLDEPIANLDPAHQLAVLDLARRLSREGFAVVAVLHDLNHAAQFADRVALLVQGRMLRIGSPAEILQPALIEEAYGMRARVLPHPDLGVPWVLPLAAGIRAHFG